MSVCDSRRTRGCSPSSLPVSPKLFPLGYRALVVRREDAKGVARRGFPPRGARCQAESAGLARRSCSRALMRRFVLAVACVTR